MGKLLSIKGNPNSRSSSFKANLHPGRRPIRFSRGSGWLSDHGFGDWCERFNCSSEIKLQRRLCFYSAVCLSYGGLSQVDLNALRLDAKQLNRWNPFDYKLQQELWHMGPLCCINQFIQLTLSGSLSASSPTGAPSSLSPRDELFICPIKFCTRGDWYIWFKDVTLNRHKNI